MIAGKPTPAWRGFLLTVALSGVLSCFSHVGASQTLRVHDGDTFTLNGVRWRLWGIDAPELDQTCQGGMVACGEQARDHLEALIAGRLVTCEEHGRSYDRLVGLCSIGEIDLSRAQVEAGQALDYRRYSRGKYAREENAARTAQRGIWAGDFVTPENWRRGTR